MKNAPKFWQCRGFLSYALLPLSFIYMMLYSLRVLFSTPYIASIPVICVGNITAGGTGKTPFCLLLARLLKNAGYKKVVIVSKGYGGEITKATVVNCKGGIGISHKSNDVGDEPLMMAKTNTVVVSKNRKEGVKFAENLGADIIILDDAMQNPTVFKTRQIVLIDGYSGFNNGFVLPSGSLRELPYFGLKRADVVIFTGAKSELCKRIKDDYKIKDNYFARFDINKDGIKLPMKVLAFAGIANPLKFFDSCIKNGIDVVERVSFADHYKYTSSDIKMLKSRGMSKNLRLLTTEKDFVRLPNNDKTDILKLCGEMNIINLNDDNNLNDEFIGCILKDLK